jgi:hypothetical protein
VPPEQLERALAIVRRRLDRPGHVDFLEEDGDADDTVPALRKQVCFSGDCFWRGGGGRDGVQVGSSREVVTSAPPPPTPPPYKRNSGYAATTAAAWAGRGGG